MKIERKGIMKFKGVDATIVGNDLMPGDEAPEFKVQTNDFDDFQGLAETSGKVRIIASVPSLETGVCDRETRRFNTEAANLDEDIIIMVISMDLPYTQKRWCGSAGIEKVLTFSDHISGSFGEKYGCLVKEPGILRRAVFVIDRDNKVVYSEYMPELGIEPDYETVLSMAKLAVK